MSSSTVLVAVLAAILIAVYVVYRLALPRPLAGIPCNQESAQRLLGDIPDLISELSGRGDFAAWLAETNLKSGSIINQVFLRPFGRPFVILADHQESRHLHLNRTKEFDCNSDAIDIFQPVLKSFQPMLSTGPEWRLHRRLVKDTMSPAFLHDIAAPSIYEDTLRFVDLWNFKADVANGRPFPATEDISQVTFDAVLAFTFGSEFPHRATSSQVEGLRDFGISSDHPLDKPIEFPVVSLDDELESMTQLVKSMEAVQSSAWPRLSWMFIRPTASFKRYERIKNACIRREVKKAVDRLKQNAASEPRTWARSAVDHIVGQEHKLADKGGRAPDYYSPMLLDEVGGYHNSCIWVPLLTCIGIWLLSCWPRHYWLHAVLGHEATS